VAHSAKAETRPARGIKITHLSKERLQPTSLAIPIE